MPSRYLEVMPLLAKLQEPIDPDRVLLVAGILGGMALRGDVYEQARSVREVLARLDADHQALLQVHTLPAALLMLGDLVRSMKAWCARLDEALPQESSDHYNIIRDIADELHHLLGDAAPAAPGERDQHGR